MKHIHCSYFFSFVISFALLILPLPLIPMVENMSSMTSLDKAIIQNSEEQYIYLGQDMSDIIHLVHELSNLDKNEESPIHCLNRHIQCGYTIAQRDDVIEALMYAEKYLDCLDYADYAECTGVYYLESNLEKVIDLIAQGSLTINSELLQSQDVQKKVNRAYTHIMQVQGLLSVNDQLVQNITAVDLSVTDAIISTTVTITPLATAGVVHNNASGLLSSSLIVNADVDPAAAIVDTKLATISTAGKVANSATTATSANTASAIVARDASGNFSAGTITANLSGNATTATTATNFSGSLVGDVTGTQGATVVSTVGGQTAANVAAGAVLANAATSANTASTIVRRTASGDFSAGAISVTDAIISTTATITPFATAGVVHNDASGLLSSSLIVNADVDPAAAIVDTKLATISTAGKVANSATTAASANTASAIVARDGSGNFSAGTITANLSGNATTATTATNFSGSLVGDVTGTQGATVVSTVGGQTAANVAAGAVLANAATSANTASTIVRRDASGDFSAGAISVTDAIISTTATITPFATAGVVHNDASGLLSSSLIVNADVDPAAAIVDTKLATISTAGKVANSATTATSANTASAIVARDASGNFSAGTITANLSGNATTATTATNFSGSLVGDVTGTQGATVVSTVGGQTAANVAAGAVLANAATSANTASTIVRRDASGDFSAGAISVTDAIISTTATITPFATAGVVHNDASGLLSSSLIVNADVDPAAAIVDTKLATISTAGKVANSATTGTNLNNANTLVLRDSTGSFAAQIVSVVDTVASGNLVLSTNPSTSTAGNILKAGNRFIHNFGTNNTFVGINAGNFTMTGTGQNTALGVSALTANTTGNSNTALGYGTLVANTTGANNIAIGYQAGQTITTGSGNIYINADAATVSENSTIRIGTSQVQCFIAGISGIGVSGDGITVDGNGQLGITLSSERFKHNIQDMNADSENIFNLRPVTFAYNDDESETKQWGLIAEEVEKVFPALVTKDENGLPYTVRYHLLPALLLNEIQKQQKCIDGMKKEYITREEMNNAINSLRAEMSKHIVGSFSE